MPFKNIQLKATNHHYAIANRIQAMTESQTLAMAQLSRELIAEGHDIINLSLGEPDFFTPEHVKQAAKEAIDQNFSFYTPVPGYMALREAIAQKFKRDNQLQFEPNQIVVSTGAKQSIVNVLMSIVNPGDEVIVPAPYWVSYYEMIRMAGGVPIIVETTLANNFKITPQELENAITPKTKAFLFSSPGNPTGSVYGLEALKALAHVFEQHPGIWIISDEIYEYIVFDEAHHSIATLPNMSDRTIVINGLSKGFAMTGWRLGYIGAPKVVADACIKMQGQYTSATSSITQRAAIAALSGPLDAPKAMCKAYHERAAFVYKAVSALEGFKPNKPQGAFYIFPEVDALFGRKTPNGKVINTSNDLTMYLLHAAHVALVSGDAFGKANCIRISYATSMDVLEKAMTRLQKAIADLV